MAITLNRQSYEGEAPIIYRDCKTLPGGFSLTQKYANGTLIKRGTPIFVDTKTHTAIVCKCAQVGAGTTTKAIKVAKGHLFQVGDEIVKDGDDATIATIVGIEKGTSQDTLNLSVGLSATQDNIIELKDRPVPNTVTSDDLLVEDKGLPAIDAAYSAVVLYHNTAVYYNPAWISGLCLKDNPNILLITQ